MQKSLLIICLIILVFGAKNTIANNHHESGNTITIQASGEVQVTADLILFNVNITQFNAEAREAFLEHKKQEAYLTSLLLEEGIEERYISANPINISSVRRSNNLTGYETRQQVQITLHDISQFESMQIALIENGFGVFTGNFSSSDLKNAQTEALKKAVEEARNKATILADAAGLRITGVQNIEYGIGGGYSPGLRGVSMALEMDSSGSLLQFEHKIPVSETVKIVYKTEPI
ncbi:MAG: SIMPL domain-containing protein [Balneolaceae bacterium]|nr:SIMPL domain-containing protein [Balneolaceae bacterium]